MTGGYHDIKDMVSSSGRDLGGIWDNSRSLALCAQKWSVAEGGGPSVATVIDTWLESGMVRQAALVVPYIAAGFASIVVNINGYHFPQLSLDKMPVKLCVPMMHP
ncbi:hypothetical protein BYT27DRAFT_7209484 [Phlegmacium glaucopus]|nr:hypothetical protein BYT27DRAFT_7209484 [Phlegmacium glaucopus]